MSVRGKALSTSPTSYHEPCIRYGAILVELEFWEVMSTSHSAFRDAAESRIISPKMNPLLPSAIALRYPGLIQKKLSIRRLQVLASEMPRLCWRGSRGTQSLSFLRSYSLS
jgi:hypothetical protein